jgi:hypothetical protein
MHAFVRIGLASLLFFAFHASAENPVCIGGDLDHLSAAQQGSCRGIADRVRIGTTKFHPPADWHFYVLCTDADWKKYAAFSTRSAQELATLDADTDLRNRVTFLRGEHLLAANVSGLDKILAHEVASALLESTDEKLIGKQVALLLPEPDQTKPVLQAAR